VDDTGLELTALSSAKTCSTDDVTALLTAPGTDAELVAVVARLVAVWPDLSASDRVELAELVGSTR
jgi:hypothetical protein